MTTPAAPGAPDGGQQHDNGQQPAPGAQDDGRGQQGQQQAPGASAQQPPNEPEGQQAQDVDSLPDWAQKLIRDARKDASKARTSAKQQAADEATRAVYEKIGKALGLEADEQIPEHVQQKIAEADERATEAEARAVEAAYRDIVRGAAPGLSLDADALLDSGSFREAVWDELDEEFDEANLAKAVEKIAKRPEFKKPRFAKALTAARSGSDMPGGQQPQKRPHSLGEAINRHYSRI